METQSAFRSPSGEAFVDVYFGGIRETYELSDPACLKRLQGVEFALTGKLPSQAAMRGRIRLLEVAAQDPGAPVREVHIRVGQGERKSYIDLGDKAWRAVEIDANGHRIIAEPPIRFVRPHGVGQLPIPTPGGTLELLRPLLNLRDTDEFAIILYWILNTFRNAGGHPVLVVQGSEGTAKSVLVSLLRRLVDPSHLASSGLPRTEPALKALAKTAYLQTFDNVPSVAALISDALCRLSTQGDARPIVLNGIGALAMAPDLADRSIVIHCDPISEARRRPESEIFAEFDKFHPLIFGALLDAMVQGFQNLPTTRPVRLPRMADFALWATACATSLISPASFDAVYRENRRANAETMIDADPVGAAVRDLMDGRNVWAGTATELCSELGMPPGPSGCGSAISARDLSVKLRKIEALLNKVGIRLEFAREGNGRHRMIRLWIDQPPSVPTAAADQDRASLAGGSSVSRHTAVSGPNPDRAGLASDFALADGADGENAIPQSSKSLVLARRVHAAGRDIPVFQRRRRLKREPVTVVTSEGLS